MNGFMHGSQGLESRSNQAEFLGNSAVNDRRSLFLRGLPTIDSQQGTAFEYNSGLARSSDQPELVEAPVSFDFLGGHQHLTRSHHPGIPQPRPGQQPGYNDMHLLQQQLMYRQLQEIQRQQQLQQLCQAGRLQNQFNQFSGTEKQLAGVQVPAMLSGTPIHSAPNLMWSMGGDSRTPSSSQNLLAENWAQSSGSPSLHGLPNGLMFSHDHGVGTVPQQLDQSLYGTPVINTRGSSNYSQFPQMFECTNMVTRAVGNQAGKPDAFSFQNEVSQGKGLFGDVPVQNPNDGMPSESCQQVNHLAQSVQAQEFLDRQEQSDWSGNLQHKSEQQGGFSHGVTNLDSTEAKLLFSTNDDSNWNSNVSKGGYLHGNPLESNDYFGGFPSIQSGSWSALMQEALGASSSDNGAQEEWGGLNVSNPELPSENHSTDFGGNRKQHGTWDNNNMQTASPLTSNTFPLFNDGDKGSTCLNDSNFRPSTESAYKQEGRVQNDSSCESFQQAAIEANKRLLDQSDKRKHFEGSSLQGRLHFDDASNGVWTRQMQQESGNNAKNMEVNMQNVHAMWVQQNLPLQNVIGHPRSKPNGRSINEPVPHGGPNSLEVHDSDDKIQAAQMKDVRTHMGRDLNPAMKNSNTQKINQQVVTRHQDDFPNLACDSSVNLKGDREPSGVAQTIDSSLNITEQRSCETYDEKQESRHRKEVCNEGYMYNYSHTSQHTDSGSDASKNLLLAVNDLYTPVGSSQKSSGQSGRKTLGPRRFHYHPMGNVEIDTESVVSHGHTPQSQGPSQLFVRGLTNQEQGSVGRSQSVGNLVRNNAADMGRRYSTDLQKDGGGTEGTQSIGAIHRQDSVTPASFNKPDHYDQNKRVGQPNQNMLELLHKVDQPRDSSTPTRFGYSGHSTLSMGPSHENDSCLQLNPPPSLQGVGLGLAPPAQARPGSNHTSPFQTNLQTADESNSRHADLAGGYRDHSQSPPLAHESSQREDSGNASIPGQACKEAQSSIHRNPNLSFSTRAGNQHHLQQQHNSHASGSSNLSFGNRDANEHVKEAAYLRQTHESRDRDATDQSAQASLSGLSGRVLPSRLASASADSRAAIASQFYSPNTGLSRPINTIASQLRSTASQLPLIEPQTVSQSSALSDTPQHVGFSTMLQHVWTNVSAQHQPSGFQPQKVVSNVLHPMNQLSSSRVTTPWLPQKAENRSSRGSALSELGTCPTNSQEVDIGQESRVEDHSLQQSPSEGRNVAAKTSNEPQGQKVMTNQLSDGDSAVSIPPPVSVHQQKLNRGKQHTPEFSLDSQEEHATLPGVGSSNRDTGAYRSDKKSSDIHPQNYSLLQQVQAMKGADSDLSKRVGKRLRGEDSSNDASQMEWKTGQRYIYGQNSGFGLSVDGKFGTASQQSSFQSGVKMLSFSSRENEDKNSHTPSQPTAREANSQNLLASAQHDLQSHIHSLSTTSIPTSTGGNEHPQISPHMAPTWFKQYGNQKNGQILAMFDGLGSSQHSAKAAAQHYLFKKASESKFPNATGEKKDDGSQVGNVWQSTPSTNALAKSTHHPPLDSSDSCVIIKPQKRKSPTSDFIPWHKEVAQGSRKLQSISMAEHAWAQAANRLVEKVEDETELIEDGSSLSQPKRRLILTTQLMQQLLPSVPTKILRENASTSYESVTYFFAKSALADACSLILQGHSSHGCLDGENMMSKSLKTSEKVRDDKFSKVVEEFIGRSRKLESDLLRSEKRLSVLDLKMECQDLERCSIINRFAKFHGRTQTEGVETSSTSENVPRRNFPQRQAIALPMPRNIPEGVLCLSL